MQDFVKSGIDKKQTIRGPELDEEGGSLSWPDGEVLDNVNRPTYPAPPSTNPTFGFLLEYANGNTYGWGVNSTQPGQLNGDKTNVILKSITILPGQPAIHAVGDTIKAHVVFDNGMSDGKAEGDVDLVYTGYTIEGERLVGDVVKGNTKVFGFKLQKRPETSDNFNRLLILFNKGSWASQPQSIPERIIGIAENPNYDFKRPNRTIEFKGMKTPIGTPVPPGKHEIHCFLRGTLIKVENGYKAIEDIQVGDYVQTFEKDSFVKKEIIAVSKSLVTVTYKDHYPVCIKKGALAENVPSQDLYVTSEHCIYMNKAFVPVRMLINGRSIVWDQKNSSYYVYHIETENHSIIESNGLLSESYLNLQKTWEKDAAAPLKVDQFFVEPIFNKLNNRAIKLNMSFVGKEYKITDEADFYLVTDQQEVIYPFAVNKGRYLFNIAAHTTKVFMSSRASRPYDVKGPYVDDRRYLGILIGEVYYINQSGKKVIDIHLKDEKLQGWNNIESSPCRWTNGYALLPLKESLPEKSILVVQVVDTNLYIDDNKVEENHQIWA